MRLVAFFLYKQTHVKQMRFSWTLNQIEPPSYGTNIFININLIRVLPDTIEMFVHSLTTVWQTQRMQTVCHALRHGKQIIYVPWVCAALADKSPSYCEWDDEEHNAAAIQCFFSPQGKAIARCLIMWFAIKGGHPYRYALLSWRANTSRSIFTYFDDLDLLFLKTSRNSIRAIL